MLFPLYLHQQNGQNDVCLLKYCEMVKPAATPSCLGGGDVGTNPNYGANLSVKVRLLLSQL